MALQQVAIIGSAYRQLGLGKYYLWTWWALLQLPRGDTTILVLFDHFTRWRDAIALPNFTADVVVDALEHRLFCYVGVPEHIHTDQGVFRSASTQIRGCSKAHSRK